RCPRSSKNVWKRSRSSAVVMGTADSVRSGNSGAAAAPGGRLDRLVGADLVADLRRRTPGQARDAQLREPQLPRALRTRLPLEEPQVEDLALPRVEGTEAGGEHDAVFRHLVLVLDLAERLERIELLALL